MEVSVNVYYPGEEIARHLLDEVLQLFDRNYYHYHYKNDLSSLNALRIIAFDKNEIVGYAGIIEYDRFFKLQNLLVCKKHRGKSIGKLLEKKRYEVMQERSPGKAMYVSCVANDLISQSLKFSIGLTPINVKYGFRKNVFHKGDVGSAVTFTSKACLDETEIGFGAMESVVQEKKSMARIKVYSNDIQFIDDYIPCGLLENKYAEILTNESVKEYCQANDGLFYSGVDFELSTGKLYHCFQIKNNVFEEGISSNHHINEVIKSMLSPLNK